MRVSEPVAVEDALRRPARCMVHQHTTMQTLPYDKIIKLREARRVWITRLTPSVIFFDSGRHCLWYETTNGHILAELFFHIPRGTGVSQHDDIRIRGEPLSSRPHEGRGRRWGWRKRRQPYDRGAPGRCRVHLGQYGRPGAPQFQVRRKNPDR